jgi:uncharacterized protein YceK
MKAIPKIVISVVLLCVISSCGTIVTHLNPEYATDYYNPVSPRVYSGVVFDYRCFHHPEQPGTNNLELFCLISMPISLVLDTLFLPYTGYQQFKYGNYREPDRTEQ